MDRWGGREVVYVPEVAAGFGEELGVVDGYGYAAAEARAGH